MEPVDERCLLVLNKLRQHGPDSVNDLVRLVHLNKSEVLPTLQILKDSGQVREVSIRHRKIYSLVDEHSLPKIDFVTGGLHSLSFDPDLVKKLSIQRMSLSPSSRINLEKKHWNHLKKSLEGLFVLTMDHAAQTLHLFFSDLVALDALYRAGVIDSDGFRESYEKLTRVYLRAYLSKEISDVVIKKFINEVYSKRDSSKLGLDLATQFQKCLKPDQDER
jgi:DNA-binding Lrp family transcriptional regulator